MFSGLSWCILDCRPTEEVQWVVQWPKGCLFKSRSSPVSPCFLGHQGTRHIRRMLVGSILGRYKGQRQSSSRLIVLLGRQGRKLTGSHTQSRVDRELGDGSLNRTLNFTRSASQLTCRIQCSVQATFWQQRFFLVCVSKYQKCTNRALVFQILAAALTGTVVFSRKLKT